VIITDLASLVGYIYCLVNNFSIIFAVMILLWQTLLGGLLNYGALSCIFLVFWQKTGILEQIVFIVIN